MRLRAKSRRRLLVLSCCASAALVLATGTYGALKLHRLHIWEQQRAAGLNDLHRGNWSLALRELTIYVQHYGKDAVALRAFIEARLHVPEPDGSHIRQAINASEQLVALDPLNPADRLALTRLYGMSSAGVAPSNNAVIRNADALLAQFSDTPRTQDALREAHQLRGAALARLGKLIEAQAESAILQRDAPDSRDAMLLDAQLRLVRDEAVAGHAPMPDFAAAKQALGDPYASPPARARAAMTIARRCEDDGDDAQAARAYRLALQDDPAQPIAQNNLAMALVRTGQNLNEARTLAEAAVSAQPRSPAFRDTLAQVLRSEHDAAGAVNALARAMALEPENPQWRVGEAEALIDAGRLPDARATLAPIAPATLEPSLRARYDQSMRQSSPAPRGAPRE